MSRFEFRIKTVACATLLLALGSVMTSLAAADSSRDKAIRLFDRVAGVPILLSDPRLERIKQAIDRNDLMAAAEVATSDDNFYNVTLRHLVSPMSNRAGDPLIGLNDFVATFIGAVRDDLDARQLLTGNFFYKADSTVTGTSGGIDIQSDSAIYKGSQHYTFLEANRINLAQKLVSEPQKAYSSTTATTPTPLTDAAGLLTTRTWGLEHMIAGTNRRAVEYALEEFLCLPIKSLQDPLTQDFRVRGDVDRAPAGNFQDYNTNCRGCHAGLDGLSGAFAYFNWSTNSGGFVTYSPGAVVAKMNQNRTIYPDGYITTNDSWLNLWTSGRTAELLNWDMKKALAGNGVRSLGEMIANSGAFASCMAQRAYSEICRRPPSSTAELAVIKTLADDFRLNGYKFRRLVQKTATTEGCI